MSLKGTKTAQNLMHAFAGESQARNRYTYYASIAKKEGFVQIQNIFLETANQEKEHAKRLMKIMNKELAGETIYTDGQFPVLMSTTAENLKAAAQGENEEYTSMYPGFAKTAREEGFEDIAVILENIAVAEKFHEARYLKLLETLNNQTTFKRETSVLWKCNNCGFIYEGLEAPERCPACDHPQAHFEVCTFFLDK
ncbi:rubrerythrin [Erysipelatoclostridium sp. AM42-17]|uniref:rubrerythrin n=1 Tax=Erysipelatoclostridium sp. AM42-17 TaxID=2293102 RepID=UPI000E4EF22E|nr:rubrerythrin family protein [Erysipelatoclostridium sp. AM42-17]RHS93994.1 rubrerythrin family protein [Erysipelatoclostridium sp. AM42-17]